MHYIIVLALIFCIFQNVKSFMKLHLFNHLISFKLRRKFRYLSPCLLCTTKCLDLLFWPTCIWSKSTPCDGVCDLCFRCLTAAATQRHSRYLHW